MASESYARGDFLANRGTPLIDSGNDLCPNNVGGHKILIPFGMTSLATGLDGAVVAPFGGTTDTLPEVLVDRPGSIVGIVARVNTAIATGTVDIVPSVNGTVKTLAAALTTAVQSSVATQAKDEEAFAAGNRLGVKISTATNLSTGLNLSVSLVVEI